MRDLEEYTKRALDGVKYGGLFWTTTPPIVEGWYWVCKVGGVPVIREYTEVTHDIYQPGVYWLGPLPVPAAPKG